MFQAIIRIFTISVLLMAFDTAETQAQGKSSAARNRHISEGHRKSAGPPPWAPAHGYRAKARYVYFKDYDVYYDHERSIYIVLSGNDWEVTAKLPVVLKGVDLRRAAKVDLDYSGDDPQSLHKVHRRKYL